MVRSLTAVVTLLEIFYCLLLVFLQRACCVGIDIHGNLTFEKSTDEESDPHESHYHYYPPIGDLLAAILSVVLLFVIICFVAYYALKKKARELEISLTIQRKRKYKRYRLP